VNLQEQGLRYVFLPQSGEFKWSHLAVLARYEIAYEDCTDMTDEEFSAFVSAPNV
jgi:hypothetical protein